MCASSNRVQAMHEAKKEKEGARSHMPENVNHVQIHEGLSPVTRPT